MICTVDEMLTNILSAIILPYLESLGCPKGIKNATLPCNLTL